MSSNYPSSDTNFAFDKQHLLSPFMLHTYTPMLRFLPYKSLTVLTLSLILLMSPALSMAEENTMDNTNERLIEMKGQIQSINGELSQQRADLGTIRAELVAQREEYDEYRRDLLKELKALRRQNQSIVDTIYEEGFIRSKNGDNAEIKPLRNYDLQTPDGKMYLGEAEYVYIKEADITIDARIDTGAAVSSISARDITEFERGGKRWYRFTIEANEQDFVVEAPFVRTSEIRQSSKDTTTMRVVVELNVKIGDYSTKSEFTLADRTKLQYPLLIGRTLLQDIAVVDVARDYIQGRNKDTYLVLNREHFKEAMKKGQDPNAQFKAKHESAAGQIAYPSMSYGSNLGTNSENALPIVRNSQNAQDKNLEASIGAVKNPVSTAKKVEGKQEKATKEEAKAQAQTTNKADAEAKKDKQDKEQAKE